MTLPPPPTLTSFTPLAGPVGTLVTLTGAELDTVTQVTFNGRMAAFSVLAPTQLTATVPVGASTGPISVTAPGGTALSTASFTVAVPPVLTITSPADGTTVSGPSVLVQGTVRSASAEVGVLVNGRPALVNGGGWMASVDLVPGSNAIEVLALDAWTESAPARITLQRLESDSAGIRLVVAPASGIPPLAVRFLLQNETGQTLRRLELDADGDGIVDLSATEEQELPWTYSSPGLFTPVLRVTAEDGATYTASTVIQVLARAQLDALLQGKWTGMKAALLQGNVEGALIWFHETQRARFRTLFTALQTHLPRIARDMQPIELVSLIGPRAQYRLPRAEQHAEGSVSVTYYVSFLHDAAGVWSIEGF